MQEEPVSQLYKSQKDRMISGVSSGLAVYFHTSPSIIRLLFILLALANGIGAVLYFMLALLLPSESEVLEEDEEKFFEYLVNTEHPEETSVKAPTEGFFNDLVVKENILAFIMILFGLVILQIDVEPWALIPESIRIPIIVVLVGFSFIVKSLHITK